MFWTALHSVTKSDSLIDYELKCKQLTHVAGQFQWFASHIVDKLRYELCTQIPVVRMILTAHWFELGSQKWYGRVWATCISWDVCRAKEKPDTFVLLHHWVCVYQWSLGLIKMWGISVTKIHIVSKLHNEPCAQIYVVPQPLTVQCLPVGVRELWYGCDWRMCISQDVCRAKEKPDDFMLIHHWVCVYLGAPGLGKRSSGREWTIARFPAWAIVKAVRGSFAFWKSKTFARQWVITQENYKLSLIYNSQPGTVSTQNDSHGLSQGYIRTWQCTNHAVSGTGQIELLGRVETLTKT